MVLNRQRRVPIASSSLENFLGRVTRLLRISRGSATICLVTEAQIARWNRLYRGKPRPTDVLSFPAESGAARKRGTRASRNPVRLHGAFTPSDGSYLGDVAIAPAVARRNAFRAGRSLDNEMRVLVLHGVLHLLGYDHEIDHGQMERLELRLRRRLGIV